MKKQEFSGAMLIELGAYLNVNFVAEVLDGKYAWTPSLYVEVLEKNTVTLSTALFDMKYMELTSGEQYGEKNDNGEWKTNKKGDVLAAKNFDSSKTGADADDEERFFITMSNDRFTYNPTTKAGYTFDGWDKSFSEGETMPNEDVTITAQWTVNKYKVTFHANSNEANCDTESSDLTYDQVYGTLPVPTRTGYSFNGWFTQAEGGDQVTAETMMTTASEHTLYAHWTINQYTITWMVDGKTHDSQTDNYGTTVKTVAAPTKDGYNFKGWDKQIPDYAVIAISWAVAEELISGTGADTISPNATATRAHVATLLVRFCEGAA